MISESKRDAISLEIKDSLKAQREFGQVTGTVVKPTAVSFNVSSPMPYQAVTFYADNLSIDLIFSGGSWIEPGNIVPPNADLFRKQFQRQRAVKALKLLTKFNPRGFPNISGMRLERLVLFCSIGVEGTYSNHVEFASGFLLFRTCLFEFAFSQSPNQLAKTVDDGLNANAHIFGKAINQSSENDTWILRGDVYEAWKQNSAVLLACFHEIRLGNVPVDGYLDLLFQGQLSRFPESNRPVVFDHLNRVIFA